MFTTVVAIGYRQLLIDNFIPPEERDKLESRLQFEEEEEVWTLKPLSEALCALYLSYKPIFFLRLRANSVQCT